MASALLADLREGLALPQPTIPPKWFYDERGSELFEAITRLPEYYPTEAERALLVANAGAIVGHGSTDTLVELGAGVSDKTTALLDALLATDRDAGPTTPIRRVAFDISADAIDEGKRRLLDRYPALVTEGVVGDLDRDLHRLPRRGRRLIALLGGTIGNYRPAARLALLRSLSGRLGSDDRLLIGMDLVKDPQTLVLAYDDAAGVTAEFNRNLIRVIARELAVDLEPAWFDHRAVWNAEASWIEMHLVANRRVEVELADDLALRLDPGEHLLTEVSAKFTIDAARTELAAAGLVAAGLWSDGRYLLGLWRRAD
ncbi:MAG: L-histidine N(alpha)-methyltransferase [Actinomycetota bacterium]